MNWFWHAMWICFIVIPAAILWLVCIYDIVFRQHDMATWKRIVWLIVVLCIPIIGALVYIGVHAKGLDTGLHQFDREHSQNIETGDEYEAQRARLETDKGW